MNYKEKYEMALEGIQEILSSSEDSIKMSRLQLRLQGIFPELKESEDERIRKEMIDFFQETIENVGYSPNIFTMNNAKKWIAWLEKQGNRVVDEELSKLLNKVICRFINDPNIPYSERDEVSKKIVPYVEHLEKQGEQKSIDNLTQQEAMDIAVAKCFNEGEQKPAWSEEDENIKESIITGLEMLKDGASNQSLIALYNKKIDWLKSLKDRMQPQPKQEWSEEDETYSDHVITAIKSYYTDDLGEENPWREELLRWLKSLRPQSTWKPSKEQITALEWQLKNTGENSWQYKETKELLEQLKTIK